MLMANNAITHATLPRDCYEFFDAAKRATNFTDAPSLRFSKTMSIGLVRQQIKMKQYAWNRVNGKFLHAIIDRPFVSVRGKRNNSRGVTMMLFSNRDVKSRGHTHESIAPFID